MKIMFDYQCCCKPPAFIMNGRLILETEDTKSACLSMFIVHDLPLSWYADSYSVMEVMAYYL
jgi:hypothetical protein